MLSGKVCDWIKLMLEVKDTLSINSPPSPLPDLPCNIISSSSANHTIKSRQLKYRRWGPTPRVGGGGRGGGGRGELIKGLEVLEKLLLTVPLGLSQRAGGRGFSLGYCMYKHAFEGLSEQVLH